MLEGLATWVLNTYLGQYLENLNTDQLSIGLLKGEVELENVPLRKDALRHLDISLEVRAGFVGKVRLQIPVSRLRSEPWIIVFEQLYLVVGPIDLTEYDVIAEENASFGRKMAQLENIEAIWRSDQDCTVNNTSYGSSYMSWLSYGTSFITNILENIQLRIQDVHIRYEDNQSKPGEIFAGGLTIELLTMQSSDEHWVPKFVCAEDKGWSYKVLELKNFGIYWDTSTEHFSDKSIGELAAVMVSSINGGDHQYIVEPVCASACLKRNMSLSPLRSRSTPRFSIDLKLEKIPFALNDFQYSQIISSVRWYDRLETAKPYRKWRPKTKKIKGNARVWWNYAIRCHLQKIAKRYEGRNWNAAYKRAKNINDYVRIYCDHLRNPISVPAEMHGQKSEIERLLSFEELRVLREICMKRVAEEELNAQLVADPTSNVSESSEGLLQSWFPAWGGWYTAREEDKAESQYSSFEEYSSLEERDVVSHLEEEILYVISDSIENNTFMKRDAVFAQLSFSLKKGNVTLSRVENISSKSNGDLTSKEISVTMFQLDFSNVKIAFESRPRNQSFLFNVELGTVSLKDQVTENTSFPLIISQQRDNASYFKGGKGMAPLTTAGMYARLSNMISSVSRAGNTPTPFVSQMPQQGPLFSLSYEKKPSRTQKIDHRLVISSQVLDVVYNKKAFETIWEFFLPLSLRQEEAAYMQSWTSTVRKSYEELKQQTKEELKKNLDSVIQSIMAMERKRWDIELNISAPQIIFPENFEDPNATIVIFDFGKLVFCTSQQRTETVGKTEDVSLNSDDEDEFATPCSTPEEIINKESHRESLAEEKPPEVTQANFHKHLYDKFDLKLCDMQVLVAKVKDNWRFAYQKGTGPMHVVDRFNINLHLERRVLDILPEGGCSSGPQWPHLMLSGGLPHLVVHVNEQKVQAMRNICSKYLFTDQKNSQPESPSKTYMNRSFAEDEFDGNRENILSSSSYHSETPLSSGWHDQDSFNDEFKEAQFGGKLIVMQFNVEKLSIELQSRGRSIAELQVTGVKAQVSKRPTDISASLSIHSLLLVDALQTFGSDFELLVASHKHISMDSVSGSLLDSEPCSPVSPASPDSSMVGKPTSPVALSQALSSLAFNRGVSPNSDKDKNDPRSPQRVVSPLFDHTMSNIDWGRDSEALINIEMTYVITPSLSTAAPATDSSDRYIYSSIQFNALDVIANQQTVVEIIGFIHQLFAPLTRQPSRDETAHPSTSSPDESLGAASTRPLSSQRPSFYGSLAGLYNPTEVRQQSSKSSIKAEVSFDFQKLTILLLRGAIKDKELVGRKVGTAVLSQAKIEASVVKDILTCEGFLGGFQIRDVTPEGCKHQCILSVGHDPIVERSQDLVQRLHTGVYQSHEDSKFEVAQKAFSFKVVRPLVLLSRYEEVGFAGKESASRDEFSDGYKELDDSSNKICVQLHLASVCYTHSPHFLLELNSCAQEFRQYMAKVVSSIKQAATEVAMGLVSKRIESFTTLSGGARDTSPRHQGRQRYISLSKSTDTLVFPQAPPASTLDSACLSPTQGLAPDLSFNTELDVVLETPIIVLPQSFNSSNVLVAHLGQISIRNKQKDRSGMEEDPACFLPTKIAVFEVLVKDMSLFTLNVDERLLTRDITFHPLSVTMMNAEDLYSCKEHGTPILHSTSLELNFEQHRDPGLLTDYEAGLVFPSDIYLDVQSTVSSDSFVISGGIVTPLKVSVSRRQYQLICQAVSNLSISDIMKGEIQSQKSELDPIYESENLHKTGIKPPPQKLNYGLKSFSAIKGNFSIPSLCVELRGDACETERPLANLVISEISTVYEAIEPFKSKTQITLRSLAMEDLHSNNNPDTRHFLIKSENLDTDEQDNKDFPNAPKSAPLNVPKISLASSYVHSDFISVSCPEVWFEERGIPFASSSLPAKLEMEKPFYKALKKPKENVNKKSLGKTGKPDSKLFSNKQQSDKCPVTPPPSPMPESSSFETGAEYKKLGALVNISICSVDPRCPEFMSKYDGNTRFVDIDLNSLVTVVNLESWVMVFDFFRSSSDAEEKNFPLNKGQTKTLLSGPKRTEDVGSVMEVQVRSFTLVLNTPAGEMAKFAVNQVSLRSVGSAGDLTLSGRLGSLSLTDCTSYGSHYKQRFLTMGSEAMTFQLFSYSEEDPSLLRKCDIRLKLKMSSIMYVHSHRFVQELTQFFQQFLLLRDKLSDWRALSAGLKACEKSHGTRVSLDISAGSPVIFIPMSNHSDDVLAVDLGSLSVSNQFLWSGNPETISKVRRPDLFDRLASSHDSNSRSRSASLRSRSRSGSRRYYEYSKRVLKKDSCDFAQKCLLDVMKVSLVNMDLFQSQRTSKSLRGNHSNEDFDKENDVWNFGCFSIKRKGTSLLKEKCALSLQVERNLDGELCRIVPDFSIQGMLTKIHFTVDITSYKLIRGILAHNLGEPVTELELQPIFISLQHSDNLQRKLPFSVSHIWTTLSIYFDLDDVIVEAELIDESESGNHVDEPSAKSPFARVNFIKSKLMYESFSDSSKDVDLVSQEILISDTRFKDFPMNKRANVFSNILCPARDQKLKNENPMQAEVHYRSTRDVTRFTILLNNMRMMAILDWLETAHNFIQSSHPPPSEETLAQSSLFLSNGPGLRLEVPRNFEDCRHPSRIQLEYPDDIVHECYMSLSPTPAVQLLQEQRSPVFKSVPPRLNPMVESTGLMTKHSLIAEEYMVPFELKLNITDSELVIVENSSQWDTSAVILKTTAVVSYRPQFQERPVSCNFNQCELYSCNLGYEDSTALSIIDPVTINIEVNDRATRNSDVNIGNIALQSQHTVEISLHQLNVRLSYHDMKMFQRILESLPRQKEEAVARKNSRGGRSSMEEPANVTAQVENLSDLGFSYADCQRSLKACGGKLDEAALWLTQNAHPQLHFDAQEETFIVADNPLKVRGFELKTGSVNLIIIDDCGDCDVPLLEFCFSHLGLKQDCEWKGSASCTLSVDYYNRALSCWEPFVEPWKCRSEWLRSSQGELSNRKFGLHVSLVSEGIVNVTLTSTLLDLYHLVKTNWTDDYYSRERFDCELDDGRMQKKEFIGARKRMPFVPFAIKNDTGCDMSFYPLTETNRATGSSESILGEIADENWQKVSSGKTVSFAFEEKGKQRHGNSHSLKSHRLIVKIGNWNPVGPVTVDKVGVFFRLALYQDSVHSTQMPSVRIVFDISMDGQAKKLIRVRSALMLTNNLPHAVELKLENIAFKLGDVKCFHIPNRSSVPIPLNYLWSNIYVKPLPHPSKVRETSKLVSCRSSSWVFCRESIQWKALLSPMQENCESRVCPSLSTKDLPYRFYVHVLKENYPTENPLRSNSIPEEKFGVTRSREWVQPGHSITLLSPLTISNLLPFELHYEVKSTGDKGLVKTGQDIFISSVDPEVELDVVFWIDNFHTSSVVTISPGSSYTTSLKLVDSSGRPIHLQIRISRKYGKALKVKVSAFFWLINKTGLPMIFKQEGSSVEAAGQDDEHEVARSAAPLLFSFSDLEASPTVVARIGRNLHGNSHAHFCKKFPLTQGTRVRRLHVGYKDHRPDLVYEIGVDVRTGRGKYRDTYRVTLSPRFHLENRSSHQLLISQKCFTSTLSVGPEAQSTWLRAISGCWLPFHWPRLDKDPLLCIYLCDIPGGHWSGGFLISETNSFHINIRDSMGRIHFVRVEVLMSEATFFVVFTDPETLPPPFRIDNFSLVPITYFQTGTHDEYLRSVVKPRYCVSYAWDEVILPPHLTCLAPGGSSATYNLDVLGEGGKLTYENFIYIAFTGTFKEEEIGFHDDGSTGGHSLVCSDLDCLQLVLDVTEGSRVRLSRKEMSGRSQLWRMTSVGLLQHEGSSPPFDPAYKKPRSNTNILVLDIAGPAPLPTEYTPLMLRKPDDRRRSTQTWRFTADGRLCCQHRNLFVQAKDGFLGLSSGSDVVLGPPQFIHYGTMSNGVPIEQSVGRQKLRPGSGVLTINVVMDGPTRVLQITDLQNKNSPQVARTESGDFVYINESGVTTNKAVDRSHGRVGTGDSALEEIQIHIVLERGIGLSLVSPPEELLYALFSNFILEYLSSSGHRNFDCSIRDIQVDNQLPKGQSPISLFVTSQSKSDQSRHLPALQISSYLLKSPNVNAYIFKHLMVTVKNLTLTIEEALLCKCLVFLGYDKQQAALEKVEESEYETQRMLAAATSANSTRYYFTLLKLVLNQVRLSVLTSKNLTPELRAIRRKQGLTLVQFENALVSLNPFVRCHPFETSRFLIDSIKAHYEGELRSQAMRILGSTDFLGNPFGLLADVSEGVQELVRDGSVGGLFMNVAHGIANSTAKVTGTLSNAVGRVTMDTKYEETRERLLAHHFGDSPDHLLGGLMGFGLGLYGGLTSIVAQTYTGATKEGLPGFFSGFAKGLVGTVTKPAIGFLDLAAGTASAVRETSKNPSHKLPPKIRKPRLVVGINGILPRFSENDASGQELMASFDSTFPQIFFGYEVLRSGDDDLRVLISSEQVLIFSWTDLTETPSVVLKIGFRDLYICRSITLGWEVGSEEPRHYIELTMKAEVTEPSYNLSAQTLPSQLPTKRPKVRCDSVDIANKVSEEINFARTLFEEFRHTLPHANVVEDNDN